IFITIVPVVVNWLLQLRVIILGAKSYLGSIFLIHRVTVCVIQSQPSRLPVIRPIIEETALSIDSHILLLHFPKENRSDMQLVRSIGSFKIELIPLTLSHEIQCFKEDQQCESVSGALEPKINSFVAELPTSVASILGPAMQHSLVGGNFIDITDFDSRIEIG
ncbi:MAG: hypothetical protein EZS28_031332, partial [Streblomastix strix]